MKKYLTNYFGNIYKPGAKYGHFLATLLMSGIAYGLYRGVQDNYLAQIVHISEFERGIVEFFRELPGLLVVLILAAMHRMSASKIFKIGTAIMLAGMVGLTVAGTGKFIVVVFVVVFSLGEHMIMPVKSTINLDLAKQESGGMALGVAGSITQLGSIVGLVIERDFIQDFSSSTRGQDCTGRDRTNAGTSAAMNRLPRLQKPARMDSADLPCALPTAELALKGVSLKPKIA